MEAVAGIPTSGDPNVQKILEGIRKSMQDAEKKALRHYRTDTARRHDILGRMRAEWRTVRGLMSRLQDCVAKAHAIRIGIAIKGDRTAQIKLETRTRDLLQLAGGDHLGQHHGGGFKRFQLVLAVIAHGLVLDNKNTECPAGPQDRRTEKGMENLLTGFRQIGKGRV